MNKSFKKNIIGIILFIILFTVSGYMCAYVLAAKECRYKTEDFFHDKTESDVLFFGSSHTENFFDPMALWRDYGITSYNLGNPEEPIPVTYWVMANAIKIKKPKVIVFDVFMINNTNPEKSMNSCIHYGLDPFPLNGTKISAINDLCTDMDTRLDLLFPISSYHSRWKDVGNDHKNDIDYFVKGSLSYGHSYTMNVQPFAVNEITDELSYIDEANQDLIYINRIIDLCNANDINLVFTCTPYSTTKKRQMDVNAIQKLAEQRNIPFVNFIKDKDIIDFKIDLYNVEHVNQSGLAKVTDYMGKYLVDTFELENRHDDVRCVAWETDLSEYRQLKMESVWAVDSLESTLMLLHDKEMNAEVFIASDLVKNSDTIVGLLNNIGKKASVTIDDSVSFVSILSREGIGEENNSKVYEEPISAVVVIRDYFSEDIKIIKVFCVVDDKVVCDNIFVNIKPEILFKE